jgi:AcrR family transcriptional regulator
MRKNSSAEIRKPEILENYYQVLIEEGFEGASIGKIAGRMGIHPSLVIHYFKTKENMTVELVDWLIEKYEAPEFMNFDHIAEPAARFKAFMDTLFSYDWSRTVDPGVHFGFYYLSFRNTEVRQRFEAMFRRFRDFLIHELERFRDAGVVRTADLQTAADLILTLMEGLEFHAHFLAAKQPFERFARAARALAAARLTGEPPAYD